ncbi:hypothetical protein MJO29_009954 [Puccinia striiformis f. sp. tritici]|nr:hypothetical protein MJO29_009954 [Puccinia striiformis f. sp. tritici]
MDKTKRVNNLVAKVLNCSLSTGNVLNLLLTSKNGATNQMINVPGEETQGLLEHNYPGQIVNPAHTPAQSHQMATRAMQQMGINFDQISLEGVWSVYDEILPRVQVHLITNNPNVPESVSH